MELSKSNIIKNDRTICDFWSKTKPKIDPKIHAKIDA